MVVKVDRANNENSSEIGKAGTIVRDDGVESERNFARSPR